jgi:hypothetical protein
MTDPPARLHAEVHTLEALAGNGVQYKVPRVQRPYEWPAHYARKLLESVAEGYQLESACWLNCIYVLEEAHNTSTSTGKVHELYDGQQRFMTLQIIGVALAMVAWKAHSMTWGSFAILTKFLADDSGSPRISWVDEDETRTDGTWQHLEQTHQGALGQE